jgi:hypothetical protein
MKPLEGYRTGSDEEFEGFDEFDIAENIEIVGGIDIEQAENDRDIRDDVEAGWSRAVDCSFPLPVLSHRVESFLTLNTLE